MAPPGGACATSYAKLLGFVVRATSKQVVERLRARGAVCVATDDFGEMTVALNASGVTFSSLVLLGQPSWLPLCFSAKGVLNRSKIDVVMELVRQGWRLEGRLVGAWSVGDPLVCDSNLSRPLSYFAVLLRRSEVADKGVQSIPHTAVDAFYRCLLLLPARKVQAMLRGGVGKSSAFYVEQLRAAGPLALQHDAHLAIEDGLAVEGDAQPDGGILPLPPLMVGELPPAWTRVRAKLPCGYSLRVYFDHFSHSSSVQRGFVNCSAHPSCIKYEFVTSAPDKATFVAKIVAWERLGEGMSTKEEHLVAIPDQQTVATVKAQMTLEDF